ncbi:MAG: hypothetical protein QOJ99_1304 [Bryobacterales bacterium]|nr:hypothetical protein [Bryobacterales bacterium]
MGFDIEMRVPVLVDVRTAVDQFNEANAPLSEATSYQALPGETLSGPPFQTVELVGGIEFFRQGFLNFKILRLSDRCATLRIKIRLTPDG